MRRPQQRTLGKPTRRTLGTILGFVAAAAATSLAIGLALGGSSNEGGGRPLWLTRLCAALSRWRRPTAGASLIEPSVVGDELHAWATDDQRWGQRRGYDWESLLTDAIRAWRALGPRLAAIVDVGPEIASLEGIVEAERAGDPANRQLVTDVAEHFLGAFRARDALTAALEDLLESAERLPRTGPPAPEVAWRLVLLASVGETQGHAWGVLADRLLNVFERDDIGAQISHSARRAVTMAPRAGHSIVWVAIDQAWVARPDSDSVVELYDGDWLLAVLSNWEGDREGVPPELGNDPSVIPNAWERLDRNEAPEERRPVVFARVDLGEGPTAGAVERAYDTLELLIARAAERQGGTNWRLRDLCLHYVDGRVVYESSGIVGDQDLVDRLTRLDILAEPTGAAVKDEARLLGDHLPISGKALREPPELSHWLTQARLAPAPARLVLSGRILERCAGWASLSPGALISDFLILPWCWKEIARRLRIIGRAAVLRRGRPASSALDADEWARMADDLLIDRGGHRPRQADPWATLEWLPRLIEGHSRDSEIGEALGELTTRLADGPSAAGWIDQLEGEAVTLHSRANRTRNAIVHGGPVITQVVRTVVGFNDALATRALGWTIDARLADRDLPAYFRERQERFGEALDGLREGGSPIDLLPAPEAIS